MVLVPAALYGFFAASTPSKAIPARDENPADQLKEKKVDARREALSSLFLGATIAFGAAAVIILGGIIVDYKNSQGLFAVALPAATFPPAPDYILPPAPELDDQGGIAGKNNVVDTTKSKGSLLQ